MKRYNTHGQKLRFPPSEKAQFLTECGIFRLRLGGCHRGYHGLQRQNPDEEQEDPCAG